MIIETQVLSPEELLAIRQELAAVPFRDGRGTAGPAAGRVKHNEQARGDHPA